MNHYTYFFVLHFIVSITILRAQEIVWVKTMAVNFLYDHATRPLTAVDSMVFLGFQNPYGLLNVNGRDTMGFYFKNNGQSIKPQTITPGNCTGFSSTGGAITTHALFNQQNDILYLAGNFSGNIDVNESEVDTLSLCSNTATDFILKLSRQGSTGWAYANAPQTYGPLNILAISTDSEGALYIAGQYYANSNNFDLDLTGGVDLVSCPPSTSSFFLSKYSATGVYQWSVYGKSIPLMGDSRAHKVVVDQNGNVFVGGVVLNKLIWHTTDGLVDSFQTTSGGWDVFVLKVDKDGRFKKMIRLGNASLDLFNAMTIDNNDQVYINISASDSLLFPAAGNTTVTHVAYGVEHLNVKFDNNLHYLWHVAMRSDAGIVRVRNMEYLPAGVVVVVGHFFVEMKPASSSPQTQLNAVNSSNQDGFVAIYNAFDGSLCSAFVLGGAVGFVDDVVDVTAGGGNRFYVTGFFSDTTSFDPISNTIRLTVANPNTQPENVYLAGYNALGCGVVNTKNKSVLSRLTIFPNPAYDHIKITSSSPIQQISIYDITGNMVKSHQAHQLSEYMLHCPIDDLSPGIYQVVTLNQDGGMIYGKLVKM